ncbi:MAG: hypothetical protein R3E68_14740 [Burkholderiaceae bacterium]
MKPSATVPAGLSAIAALAVSLEKFDRGPGSVEPDQYRLLVARLSELLLASSDHPGLAALLARFPSAGELYENLHYKHAGLCLRELDRALGAEQLAVSWLRKAARR